MSSLLSLITTFLPAQLEKGQIPSKNFEEGRKGPSKGLKKPLKGSKKPIKEDKKKSNGNLLIYIEYNNF
jgi:hypothetical protein